MIKDIEPRLHVLRAPHAMGHADVPGTADSRVRSAQVTCQKVARGPRRDPEAPAARARLLSRPQGPGPGGGLSDGA